jgi:hypothetical protein
MEIKTKITSAKLMVEHTKPIEDKLVGAPFQWSISELSTGLIKAVNGTHTFEGSLEEFNRRLK